MQCGTCKEASSTQLPVSEVCRHCHNFSRWCQEEPVAMNVYPVTLYLHEYGDGERYVSSSKKKGRVIAKKKMLATFDHVDLNEFRWFDD